MATQSRELRKRFNKYFIDSNSDLLSGRITQFRRIYLWRAAFYLFFSSGPLKE